MEIAIFPPSDSWEKTTETMVKVGNVHIVGTCWDHWPGYAEDFLILFPMGTPPRLGNLYEIWGWIRGMKMH